MLAKVSANLMPPPSLAEQIAITKVHSLHSLCTNIISERPYRAPHHSINLTALLGGGPNLIPGEISLAHLGVLHLDELPEFRRDCLEALRQPLENHFVKLDRINGHTQYPADFMLIATMNPCPCGYFQSNIKECTCSPSAIQRYRQKLSGPLLDRIDITTPVLQEPDSILHHGHAINTKQHTLAQKQIHDAVQQQHLRYHDLTRFNSRLSSLEITRYCHLTKTAKDLLSQASNHYCLSARSYFKIIKVAQTIADLELSPKITPEHISEAIQYRPQILN